MKITKTRLKQIIKEELQMLGSLEIENNFIKKYNLTEQDWGGEGRRFNTDQMRSDLPLDSYENLSGDRIEVAVRDAIHNDEDLDAFAAAETMVTDMSNKDAVMAALEDDIESYWKTWEKEANSPY